MNRPHHPFHTRRFYQKQSRDSISYKIPQHIAHFRKFKDVIALTDVTTNSYGQRGFAGISVAASHVAGTAALLLSFRYYA
ncbi:MAG: hypothetical protein LE180_04470 [Endomicrobium sp.]|uniref:hypothetical protein n=1 Tax=Candidatus Endomicrobiellum pyrsonymphae TaxID=1408203 RepID=UPI003576478A|nr:hypothetical protein [Endomicrobium sp.]